MTLQKSMPGQMPRVKTTSAWQLPCDKAAKIFALFHYSRVNADVRKPLPGHCQAQGSQHSFLLSINSNLNLTQFKAKHHVLQSEIYSKEIN